LTWTSIPKEVRRRIEARLGAKITWTESRPEGFSPAFIGVVSDSTGRRTFLKVIGPEPNPDSPEFYRREVRILGLLPADLPVPRLRWILDEEGWVVLAFEVVPGRTPRLPWRRRDLDTIFEARARLAERLTPAPDGAPSLFELRARAFRRWQDLLASEPGSRERTLRRVGAWIRSRLPMLAALESGWPRASAGRTLLHGDLRADNILLSKGQVYFVDWPDARVGAGWVDVLGMLPSVATQGGPPPWELWGVVPGTENVDSAAKMLSGLAGFFVLGALDPPPAGLPTLRRFQAAQGQEALRWLRQMRRDDPAAFRS
jgi:aminoglycoside phosphotransferase (APT) family kinase protein